MFRCAVDDVEDLEKLLKLFFDYERTEITEFRKAVEQFKTDLPMVLEALRSMIERAHKREPDFSKAAEEFLKHAQEAINPSLTEADVREMLIQHILTEEIFAEVFHGTPFHRENNVARELYKLEATFFTGDTKYETLKGMEPYYAAIRSAAAQIGTPPREADLPQGHLRELLQGLQSQRPPTGWASSTRPTRSSAS